MAAGASVSADETPGRWRDGPHWPHLPIPQQRRCQGQGQDQGLAGWTIRHFLPCVVNLDVVALSFLLYVFFISAI